jgi:hypothetical protein
VIVAVTTALLTAIRRPVWEIYTLAFAGGVEAGIGGDVGAGVRGGDSIRGGLWGIVIRGWLSR